MPKHYINSKMGADQIADALIEIIYESTGRIKTREQLAEDVKHFQSKGTLSLPRISSSEFVPSTENKITYPKDELDPLAKKLMSLSKDMLLITSQKDEEQAHHIFSSQEEDEVQKKKQASPKEVSVQKDAREDGVVPASDKKSKGLQAEDERAAIVLAEEYRKQFKIRREGEFLCRGNKQQAIFFTRNDKNPMYAVYKGGAGKIRFIQNWANFVIVKDQQKKLHAYLYNGGSGLTESMIIFGLSEYEIVATGCMKVSAHHMRLGDEDEEKQAPAITFNCGSVLDSDAGRHMSSAVYEYIASLFPEGCFVSEERSLSPVIAQGGAYGFFKHEAVAEEASVISPSVPEEQQELVSNSDVDREVSQGTGVSYVPR